MSTAYFQCVGGASGDMILGALVASGLSIDRLRDVLGRLPVTGYTLSTEQATRGGVHGTIVSVDLDEDGRRPRRWQEFVGMIEGSDLSPGTVDRATRVFARLGEAEAVVHGVAPEDVRLHELGSIDTLVDVVGAVAGLELLGVDRVYCSPLPSGSGLVNSSHGVLPVPAPVTAALLSMANAHVVPPPADSTDAGEMVTPTGAAILTTLATFRQPGISLSRVGYGLGSRDPEHYPNVLALWLGKETGPIGVGHLLTLETNIDDMSPELVGYVQEALFDLGALDVWLTPIQMKKSRPGSMLSALIPAGIETVAVELLMKETSTLGVRVRPTMRHEAEREAVTVETPLGPVSVKIKRLNGKAVGFSPEYEECRRIARERRLPLQEVYRVVERAARDRLGT